MDSRARSSSGISMDCRSVRGQRLRRRNKGGADEAPLDKPVYAPPSAGLQSNGHRDCRSRNRRPHNDLGSMHLWFSSSSTGFEDPPTHIASFLQLVTDYRTVCSGHRKISSSRHSRTSEMSNPDRGHLDGQVYLTYRFIGSRRSQISHQVWSDVGESGNRWCIFRSFACK